MHSQHAALPQCCLPLPSSDQDMGAPMLDQSLEGAWLGFSWRARPARHVHTALANWHVSARSGASRAQVGRPRPNFMARCFPEAVAEPVFHMGMPACQAGNVHANTEGRKSFPSGAPAPQKSPGLWGAACRQAVAGACVHAADACGLPPDSAAEATGNGCRARRGPAAANPPASLYHAPPRPRAAPALCRDISLLQPAARFSASAQSLVTRPSRCCTTGHTSWSTSGLGFLTLWLMGKLHVFDGTGHPARLVAACAPISLAVWIGITRLQVPCAARQPLCAGSCAVMLPLDLWLHRRALRVDLHLGCLTACLHAMVCSAWAGVAARTSPGAGLLQTVPGLAGLLAPLAGCDSRLLPGAHRGLPLLPAVLSRPDRRQSWPPLHHAPGR